MSGGRSWVWTITQDRCPSGRIAGGKRQARGAPAAPLSPRSKVAKGFALDIPAAPGRGRKAARRLPPNTREPHERFYEHKGQIASLSLLRPDPAQRLIQPFQQPDGGRFDTYRQLYRSAGTRAQGRRSGPTRHASARRYSRQPPDERRASRAAATPSREGAREGRADATRHEAGAGQVFQVSLTSGNRERYNRPLAVMHVGPALDQFLGGVLGVVEFPASMKASPHWPRRRSGRCSLCRDGGDERLLLGERRPSRGYRFAEGQTKRPKFDDSSESFGDQRSRVARGIPRRSNPKSEKCQSLAMPRRPERRPPRCVPNKARSPAALAMNASPISTLK